MTKRKIPRSIKKDIKQSLKDIKSANQSSISKKSVDKNVLRTTASEMVADGDRQQKIFSWNFKVGDLVNVATDKAVGIVIRIEDIDEGYTMKTINQRFQVATTKGYYWVGGKNLRIIQKSCKS